MKKQRLSTMRLALVVIASMALASTGLATVPMQGMHTALQLWYAHQDQPLTDLNIYEANGTGAIEGTVSSGNGNPIEGALVYAWSMTQTGVATKSTNTAADGSFMLDNLEAGEYVIVAMAEGYTPAFYGDGQNPMEAEPVVVNEAETTSGIDIHLKKITETTGAISGVVTEEGNGPIAGAWVIAFNRQNPFKMQSTFGVSNDAGEYRISNLENGMYVVAAYAYGYVAELYDDTQNPMTATPVVVNDAETSGIDFALARGASISGHVMDDSNNPIEGVKVMAMSTNSGGNSIPGFGSVLQMARTDENGDYTITGLMAGTYIVSATLIQGGSGEMKYWNDKTDPQDADPIVVEAGTAVTDIDFTFALPTARISGIVTDASGNPLKDIYISWVREEGDVHFNFGRLWKSEKTDENGYYEITNLPAGTYYVSAWMWDWMNFKGVWYEDAQELKDATPIVLADGEVRDDINMTLDTTSDYGSISGKVTLDETGDPVEYAFVSAVPAKQNWHHPWNKRLPTAYAFTDADGNYTMTPVFKGDYRVVVRVNNHMEYFDDKETWDEADIVAVSAGEETSGIDFGVPAIPTDGSMVSGMVIDEATGEALEGALVALFPTKTHKWFNGDLRKWGKVYFTTFSDENGAYVLRGIPEGVYVASAWARDYVGEFYDDVRNPVHATVLELDGTNSIEDVDFALKHRSGHTFANGPGQGRYGSIGGIIHSSSGDPVSGAFVYAIDGENNIIASEISGENGNYSLDGLDEGEYKIMASRSLYETTFYPNATDEASATTLQIDAEGDMDIPDANVTMAAGEITQVTEPGSSALPAEFALEQNYPNPFNPTTMITYHMPERAEVILQVFNVQGQLVKTLVNQEQPANTYHVVWDGTDMNGQAAPSGVYFYQFQANHYTETRAMLFVK